MTTKMSRIVLALAGIAIGCAGASIAPRLVLTPGHADAPPSRWEYRCVVGSKWVYEDPSAITAELNALGADGWELATSVFEYGDRKFTAYCFKRARTP